MRLVMSGIHVLQVEGWGSASSPSLLLTYNGADTLNTTMPITPAINPRAPSVQVSVIKDCNPTQWERVDGQFTICGFKAAAHLDLQTVDEFIANYVNVRTSSFSSQSPIIVLFECILMYRVMLFLLENPNYLQ